MAHERFTTLIVATVVGLFGIAATAGSQLETIQLAAHTSIVPNGSASGGDWVNIPLGGVGGLRDIQCGKVTGRPQDLNCDIAGGDAAHRGNVIINWDLGKCAAVFDGHHHPDVVICAGKRPWFRRPPRIGGQPPQLGAVK